MSDVQLGQLPPKDAGRDATHVAVVPMIAATEMEPGTHCGLVGDGQAGLTDPERHIGIVDPFLRRNVTKGDMFYLCLYPRTVTGLRHVYLHPALDGDQPATSRDWITLLAFECGMTYERLMAAAEYWVECDEYTYDNSETYKRVKYEKWPEFWRHYEIVTGTKVKDHKATFFTCSC
jgi:hypothetical protein